MKFTENKFHYDKENDILYYTFKDNSNSYGEEDINNVVVMRNCEDDEITGVTVLNFLRMCRNKDLRLGFISKYFDVDKMAAEIIK